MKRASAFLLAALITTSAAAASIDFPNGALPIDVRPSASITVERGEGIVIRGAVWGDAPAMLVLRVDDGQSSGYATRVNEERLIPPGAFAWNVPLAGAKTSGGRLLDASDIRRMILFEAKGKGGIRIDKFGLEPGVRLPGGALGLSFGAPDAPVIAGLDRVSPGDHRILAGRPVAVRRPGLDPVVANGLAGLEKFGVDWPRGKARVSLWTEDIGEWENLPRVLQRRIRINGVDVVDERRTPSQWIAERYLAGRDREANAADDAWTAYGRHRGGLVSAVVDVADNGVVVELAGEGATATFVSAATIEPAGVATARGFVESERRAWMNSNFPVSKQVTPAAAIAIYDAAEPATMIAPLHVAIGRGSGARLTFAVRAPLRVEHPAILIEAPTLNDKALEMDLYAAQWRLERTGAGSNLLVRAANFLRGEAASLPIEANEPRKYEAWVSADENTPPGLYKGAVKFAFPTGAAIVPIDVDVLPTALPTPPKPAGFYLDGAPHLNWFAETRGDRGRQLSCDLDVLRRYGITGNAPALSTPDGAGMSAFIDDARRAANGGTIAPWFAYTPLKRLQAAKGSEPALRDLPAIMQSLQSAGVASPIWSVADEPGNPDQNPEDLSKAIAALRAAVPAIRLGGQFNDPRDLRFAGLVDTTLINQGFGIDAAHVAMLRGRGRDVWFYNTGRPRFTAGAWLWFTGASHYLQWHARMPTADPYDPTDGREGDVQIFPPSATLCPAHPDIHVDLLEMAEGLVDQQWLTWLDGREEPAAKALRKRILVAMPADWASASKDAVERAGTIRASIMDVARGLK